MNGAGTVNFQHFRNYWQKSDGWFSRHWAQSINIKNEKTLKNVFHVVFFYHPDIISSQFGEFEVDLNLTHLFFNSLCLILFSKIFQTILF